APADIVAYIDRMERVTRVQPQNGEVWYMLGRAYLKQQRPAEAERAFGNSLARLGESPELLAQLGQARIFANGNHLDSEAPAGYFRLRGGPVSGGHRLLGASAGRHAAGQRGLQGHSGRH